MDTASVASQVPARLARLMERAADHAQARWPLVEFEVRWWADGEDAAYLARVVWQAQALAPCLEVRDARSARFVCRSMPNDFSTIAPGCWDIDYLGEDEFARYAAREARKASKGRG